MYLSARTLIGGDRRTIGVVAEGHGHSRCLRWKRLLAKEFAARCRRVPACWLDMVVAIVAIDMELEIAA